MISRIKKAFYLIAVVMFMQVTAIFANSVSQMDIDVLVHDDGSATITQKWTGTFTDGTENYIPISDSSVDISNFMVSMGERVFEYLPNWNVNASFNEKSFKCGINQTSDGIELCFGISNYGNNTYIFKYDVEPLVKSYIDYDGFNFKFVNDSMSTFPSDVNLRLRMENGTALTTDNALIWGFGGDFDVYVQNNEAIAYTNSKLRGNNSMIIMMRFNKGIINPIIKIDSTFDKGLKNKAFIGSEYEKTNRFSLLSYLMMIGSFIMFLFIVIIPIINSIKRKNELKKFYNEINYYRDTPNSGNMALTYVLYSDFDIWKNKESNIIGALILQMIHDKNLEPIKETSVGFFGREKINTSLKMVSEPTDGAAKRLFDIIKMAAGADGILQEKELKTFATKNFKILNDLYDLIKQDGHTTLNEMGGYKKILGNKLKDLSDIGKKELFEVYGLRKYLEDFTLVKEREVEEVHIWENLLIYATLFGNAKKVLTTLRKLYPENIETITNIETSVYISNAYYRTLYYSSMNGRNAMMAAKAAKMAASGLGGHASLGGGGGFSGGGSGGGSR